MRIVISAVISLVAFATVAAYAADMPKRKSGLWQISTQSTHSQRGAHTMQQCIDEHTDNMLQNAMGPQAEKMCSKRDVKVQSDGLVIDSVCSFGSTTATTHATVTGSFQSAYRLESKSSYDPPLMGMKEGGVIIDAKWLGPCKDDMQPGDVIMPGGMKMNINTMPGVGK